MIEEMTLIGHRAAQIYSGLIYLCYCLMQMPVVSFSVFSVYWVHRAYERRMFIDDPEAKNLSRFWTLFAPPRLHGSVVLSRDKHSGDIARFYVGGVFGTFVVTHPFILNVFGDLHKTLKAYVVRRSGDKAENFLPLH